MAGAFLRVFEWIQDDVLEKFHDVTSDQFEQQIGEQPGRYGGEAGEKA